MRRPAITELPELFMNELSMKHLSNPAAPPGPAEVPLPPRPAALPGLPAAGPTTPAEAASHRGGSRGGDAPLPSPADLIFEQLDEEGGRQRRIFRWTLFWAALFHMAILFVTLPESRTETLHVGRPAKVYVMEQVRFKKPPAKAAQPQREVPKKQAKKIPIPDPTPDEPEPLEVEP
ncbi:MAG: hypothetical protein MI919_42125, partial [Holophagales bacterium]|nr:hypothetical protein [Holophagales bacterium]